MYLIPHILNGRSYVQQEGQKGYVYNPGTGEVAGEVYFANAALCDEAIANAEKAWPLWSSTPALKRARILFKFRELIEKNQHELALLVTNEHGKTLDDAQGSIMRALELIEWHCGLLGQLQGDFTHEVAQGIDTHTFYQSLGVCVGISPFNFPIMVPVWMMIPAIACGNTFILKPSEQAPSATLRLIELLYEAGLPAGVVQCIQGDKETVHHLITHPAVKAVTAVASSAVAKAIYTTATALGKRAHTFGGAKNHCVVMPDAQFTQTAKAIAGAAFGSAGERCMALSVVVTVSADATKALLDKLIPEIKAIRVDIGTQNKEMGPLISLAHKHKVLSAIESGINEGATLAIDGRTFKHHDYPEGFYVGPTLFTDVSPQMYIYQHEIFGPVLAMLEVNTLDEALALINSHPYGNGTAIFTQNGHAAREFSQRVEAGMVGINIPIPVPIASHPFGGWKQSVFGDTNMHGLESIHFYTKRKTVTTRWLQPETSQSGFVMPTHRG